MTNLPTDSAEGESTLKLHPVCELFDPLPEAEFVQLFASMQAVGLLYPLIRNADLLLVDGRERWRVCRRLGITPAFLTLPPGADEVEVVSAANLHRRHLTAEQKRELATKLLKMQPERSNRQIGRLRDYHHETIGALRVELERRGEIRHVDFTQDTKGRQQPITRTVTVPVTERTTQIKSVGLRPDRPRSEWSRPPARRIWSSPSGIVTLGPPGAKPARTYAYETAPQPGSSLVVPQRFAGETAEMVARDILKDDQLRDDGFAERIAELLNDALAGRGLIT
jgi:hypothetical protein